MAEHARSLLGDHKRDRFARLHLICVTIVNILRIVDVEDPSQMPSMCGVQSVSMWICVNALYVKCGRTIAMYSLIFVRKLIFPVLNSQILNTALNAIWVFIIDGCTPRLLIGNFLG